MAPDVRRQRARAIHALVGTADKGVAAGQPVALEEGWAPWTAHFASATAGLSQEERRPRAAGPTRTSCGRPRRERRRVAHLHPVVDAVEGQRAAVLVGRCPGGAGDRPAVPVSGSVCGLRARAFAERVGGHPGPRLVVVRLRRPAAGRSASHLAGRLTPTSLRRDAPVEPVGATLAPFRRARRRRRSRGRCGPPAINRAPLAAAVGEGDHLPAVQVGVPGVDPRVDHRGSDTITEASARGTSRSSRRSSESASTDRRNQDRAASAAEQVALWIGVGAHSSQCYGPVASGCWARMSVRARLAAVRARYSYASVRTTTPRRMTGRPGVTTYACGLSIRMG